MRFKPPATTLVYDLSSDMWKKEIPNPLETLIHAFLYKKDPVPVIRGGIHFITHFLVKKI